jgi:hypothetical protein
MCTDIPLKFCFVEFWVLVVLASFMTLFLMSQVVVCCTRNKRHYCVQSSNQCYQLYLSNFGVNKYLHAGVCWTDIFTALWKLSQGMFSIPQRNCGIALPRVILIILYKSNIIRSDYNLQCAKLFLQNIKMHHHSSKYSDSFQILLDFLPVFWAG